ncbi:MAG: twitching motility protein PilT [Aquihabitans sp.]
MTVVLDSGALIALDRGERSMWIRLKNAQVIGEVPITHAGVVGQVWRGSPRQAQLSRALKGIDVRPVDDRLGRAAGQLLGAAGMSDVIDAGVVLLAKDGDDIITSDADDLAILANTMDLHIELLQP